MLLWYRAQGIEIREGISATIDSLNIFRLHQRLDPAERKGKKEYELVLEVFNKWNDQATRKEGKTSTTETGG